MAPLTLRSLILALSTLSLYPSSSHAAMYEPEGNKVWFGLWPQVESPHYLHPNQLNPLFQQPSTLAATVNGIPALNVSVPIFQIAQPMPIPVYNYTTGAGGPAPEYLIEQTITDAMVFLTVYPENLDVVGINDYNVLGRQIQDYYTQFNRTVFLRFAPEMQGVWNTYGQKPGQYVQVFRAMYTAIKAIAPQVAIVWAPNLGAGYPYGQDYDNPTTIASDQRLLDTNNNGRLDTGDDPYGPYYPGDAYVDWIGISLYYKGEGAAVVNTPQRPGYCTDVLYGTSRGQNGRRTVRDWYYTYCEQKPDKACMIAESGAAWSLNDTAPPTTELNYQQTWWRDCITNTTFLDLHPRLKMIMHFEYTKIEYDNGVADDRDYRITNDTAIRNAFIADLAPMQDRFQWANYRAVPSSVPTAGRPSNIPGIPSQEVTAPLVFNTARNTNTMFPQLFGSTGDASRRLGENVVAITVAASVGVVGVVMGGWTAVRRR